MDLTQIRYFLALARLLNFTRAAEACNVSQPALTKSIQRLEEELGGRLLLRERAHTQLTSLGQQMLPLLEHVYTSAKLAKEHAAELLASKASPLRLGVSPDVPLTVFTSPLAEVARQFTHFELNLTEACAGPLFEMLLKGEIDLCLMTGVAPLPERMNRWSLFVDAVILLVPEGLDDTGTVMLESLQDGGMAWIKAHGTATVFEAATRPLPRAKYEVTTQSQAAALARVGLGVAFSTRRAPPQPGLTQRCLGWQEAHDVLLVSVAGRPLHPTANVFLKLARALAWHPA